MWARGPMLRMIRVHLLEGVRRGWWLGWIVVGLGSQRGMLNELFCFTDAYFVRLMAEWLW